MPFAAPFLRPVTFHARIQPRPDGRFAFGRDGEMAHLVNVPDDLGYFGDCVAWPPDYPAEWWQQQRRLPILALPELTFAVDVGCDLFLVETPARFIELATTGPWPGPTACILDWARSDAVRLWLSLVKAVQCETPELARAVESVLGAAPARQRLRIAVAEPVKPAPTPPDLPSDPGTVLEPFPLGKMRAAFVTADRQEVTA